MLSIFTFLSIIGIEGKLEFWVKIIGIYLAFIERPINMCEDFNIKLLINLQKISTCPVFLF